MNQRTSITRTAAIGKAERNLFYAFLAAAVFCLGSYLYLVNQSVFNIVERNRAEEKIGQLETEVAALESDYLALSSGKINLDYAHALGFRDVAKEANYAAPARKAVTMSLANNEI